MKLRHGATGDTIELPPPDQLGASVVLFNGQVVKRVLYCDSPFLVTLEDGINFDTPEKFSAYIVEQLRSGVWRESNDDALR